MMTYKCACNNVDTKFQVVAEKIAKDVKKQRNFCRTLDVH